MDRGKGEIVNEKMDEVEGERTQACGIKGGEVPMLYYRHGGRVCEKTDPNARR